MLVFVLNQAQKANTGKIQTPVYENVREFGFLTGIPEDIFICMRLDFAVFLSRKEALLLDCAPYDSDSDDTSGLRDSVCSRYHATRIGARLCGPVFR